MVMVQAHMTNLDWNHDQVETFGRGMAMIRSTSYHTKRSGMILMIYGIRNITGWIWNIWSINHPATKNSAFYGKPLQLRDATGKVLTADTVGIGLVGLITNCMFLIPGGNRRAVEQVTGMYTGWPKLIYCVLKLTGGKEMSQMPWLM